MRADSAVWWLSLRSVFVDPPAACRAAVTSPAPGRVFAVLIGAAAMLGVATLPRQLCLLRRGLPFTGDAVVDSQHEAIREMVTRLIVVDRLVPQPTVLVAAVLVLVMAQPVLMLASDRRRALLSIAVLGLAPLVIDRIGQLAMTYVLSPPASVTPGYAITVPHRFATGPALLWRGADLPPQWLTILDARVNLVSLGSAALWSIGLQQLDGKRWTLWHVLLPVACLLGAGLLTWVLTPLILPMLMH